MHICIKMFIIVEAIGGRDTSLLNLLILSIHPIHGDGSLQSERLCFILPPVWKILYAS